MESEGHSVAEEVVRLLASAANAVRLYPPSSPLPAEAARRFQQRANDVTNATGPLRYIVDPHGFRTGDDGLAPGNNQVLALAENLHAMQVGQLIIAPDLTDADVSGFLGVATSETASIRAQGVRDALARAGVTRIAVIPVTLKASDETGLLGLDLAAAPIEEIGRETVAAAVKWSATASQGEGIDDIRTAIDRLETATQDIATARIADALMRLDEQTRMRVLAMSLRADPSGNRMKGMLDVLARMKPAALARLLRIVAAQANTDALKLAGALELPPEVAKQIEALLAPSPRTESECGVPPDPNVEQLAAEAAAPHDTTDLDRQISVASPALASGRALSTTVAVSRMRPTVEAIEAIGQALPTAARDGAFTAVREALRRLDEVSSDAALSRAIEDTKTRLCDPEVLADVVRAPMTDADAAIAGEVLTMAGTAGAEALLGHYFHADEHTRSLLRPVMRGMGEPLLAVANRRIRTDDTASAVAILRILPMLGDKRAVTVMAQGLEHLDADVRMAAVRALADTPGSEAKDALTKALGHWDPQTRRFVIREIGRVGATQAIRPLVRILEDINILERNHELKKEVIKSLESLGSPEALPVLRRWANRRFVLGRKNKELRFLARRAVGHLAESENENGIRRVEEP